MLVKGSLVLAKERAALHGCGKGRRKPPPGPASEHCAPQLLELSVRLWGGVNKIGLESLAGDTPHTDTRAASRLHRARVSLWRARLVRAPLRLLLSLFFLTLGRLLAWGRRLRLRGESSPDSLGDGIARDPRDLRRR